MHLPRAIFVTDPICSWCWGTLPEIRTAANRLADVCEFTLMMAGLQIGSERVMRDDEIRRLKRLWQEVAATTGQSFSGVLPEGFRYHSELACRAVEIARSLSESEPWAYFEALQRAFYVDAINPADPAALDGVGIAVGFEPGAIASRLGDPGIVARTRAQFDAATALAAHALPSVLLDTGEGPRLVSGGFITADFLVAALQERLRAPEDRH